MSTRKILVLYAFALVTLNLSAVMAVKSIGEPTTKYAYEPGTKEGVEAEIASIEKEITEKQFYVNRLREEKQEEGLRVHIDKEEHEIDDLKHNRNKLLQLKSGLVAND